jgi:hypothetical protein
MLLSPVAGNQRLNLQSRIWLMALASLFILEKAEASDQESNAIQTVPRSPETTHAPMTNR